MCHQHQAGSHDLDFVQTLSETLVLFSASLDHLYQLDWWLHVLQFIAGAGGEQGSINALEDTWGDVFGPEEAEVLD